MNGPAIAANGSCERLARFMRRETERCRRSRGTTNERNERQIAPLADAAMDPTREKRCRSDDDTQREPSFDWLCGGRWVGVTRNARSGPERGTAHATAQMSTTPDTSDTLTQSAAHRDGPGWTQTGQAARSAPE